RMRPSTGLNSENAIHDPSGEGIQLDNKPECKSMVSSGRGIPSIGSKEFKINRLPSVLICPNKQVFEGARVQARLESPGASITSCGVPPSTPTRMIRLAFVPEATDQKTTKFPSGVTRGSMLSSGPPTRISAAGESIFCRKIWLSPLRSDQKRTEKPSRDQAVGLSLRSSMVKRRGVVNLFPPACNSAT